MKSRVDDRLRREAERWAFVYGCEACAHFDPDSGACANGYPNAVHRAVDLDARESLEFCKEFELG